MPDHVILLAVRLFLLTLACMLPFLGGLIIFALFYQLLISRIIMVLLLIVSFFLILRMTLDYSQIFLLYLDNPYLSCREIMHQSKNLMKGNRIRYFLPFGQLCRDRSSRSRKSRHRFSLDHSLHEHDRGGILPGSYQRTQSGIFKKRKAEVFFPL